MTKISYNRGQVMLTLVIFFLLLSVTIVLGIANPILKHAAITKDNLKSKGSYYAAESALEDVYYRLQNTKQVGGSENMSLNGATVTITTTNIAAGKQVTTSASYTSNIRKLQGIFARGDGVAFRYGLQVGAGGVEFANNSFVTGSIYSNGNLVGDMGVYITGDAFVAGATGLIDDVEVGRGGTGNAHAHTIRDSEATGTIYCQVGSGNNKACNTSQADPETIDMPITEEQITEWKSHAVAGGMVEGGMTVSASTSLGPKKIAGNLTIDEALTLTDTVWVTGNLIINTGGSIALSSSYGASSGVIVVDGYTTVANNVTFQNSGTSGSYILLLSTSNCDASMSGSPCSGHNAVALGNNSNLFIVSAQNGTASFSNNAHVREAVANKIILNNNSNIVYDSGLANVNFSSGPSGGYTVLDWGEIQ